MQQADIAVGSDREETNDRPQNQQNRPHPGYSESTVAVVNSVWCGSCFGLDIKAEAYTVAVKLRREVQLAQTEDPG